jgi:hypothetical protein
MRHMSFAMTTAQFKARTKTVTRRDGWWNLKPGDRVMGCERCMGLKKGEKIKTLGVIEVVSVRGEPLDAIANEPNGCTLEGFPEWDGDPQQFIDFYCEGTTKDSRDPVNRIEFKYINPPSQDADRRMIK